MFEPKIQILTEDEMAESQRQEGFIGIKMNQTFYCSEKLSNACKHVFYDVPKYGKRCMDKDGKHYIEIFSINLPLKLKLAALSSDKNWHEFLDDCYARACELYEKKLAANAAAVKSDADFIKYRKEVIETVEKNLSEKRADQLLAESQKVKKPIPAFNQDDFKTWSSLSHEDAEASKDRLTEKKTTLLKKIGGFKQ